MVVEILFHEVCNLFGDGQNVTYLRSTLPNAEFIFTALTDEPYFSSNDPDMIYIGSMSENTQRRVIEKLLPLKSRLEALVEKNVLILATGNAADIFAKKIDYITEKCSAEALGFFDLEVKTNLFDRFNGKVLGQFEDISVVGFRSQFSFLYGDNSDCYFLKAERGIGINRDSVLEGMRKNNLICTQILGPILPLNPLLCERIIALTGSKVEAAHRDAAIAAYEQRLQEFRNPHTVFGHNK